MVQRVSWVVEIQMTVICREALCKIVKLKRAARKTCHMMLGFVFLVLSWFSYLAWM